MNSRSFQVRLLKNSPPNRTVFVLGSSGSGKTTLIANLALQEKRFVLFDTKQDFDPAFFGSQMVVGPSGIATEQSVSVVSDNSQFKSALNQNHARIIVQLWDSIDPDATLNDVCQTLMRFQTANFLVPFVGKTTVIVDETNAFVDVNQYSQGIYDVTQRGRSVGIERIFGAQWFGTVPTWMRDSFSEIVTFRHNDENGLRRLEQFGFNPLDVQELPQYTCLWMGKDGIEKVSLLPNTKHQPTENKPK